MRSLHAIIILLMILSAFCIAQASAVNGDSRVNFEILGPDVLIDVSKAPPVQGSVTQGETDSHIYTPGNEQTLEVSLTWDRSTGNDLDLYVTLPNGEANLIHDEVDGRADGKISIRTSLTMSTINQPWGFDVIGSQVSGTQSYILIINSY